MTRCSSTPRASRSGHGRRSQRRPGRTVAAQGPGWYQTPPAAIDVFALASVWAIRRDHLQRSQQVNNMAGAAHELCSSGTRGCTITVVRAYVGVTDDDRYRFLAAHQAVTGVNVWQPSGGLGSTLGLGRSSNCPYTESTDTTAVLEWHLDKVSKPYKNPDAPASTHGPISELRCPTVTRHLWRSRLRSGSQRTVLRSSLPIVSRSAQGMPWWCHDG